MAKPNRRTEPTDTRTAVLYARVSTTDQAENGASLDAQLHQLREYASRHGYIVVAEYVDRGATGTDDRRPEFQKMLTRVRTKGDDSVDAILVYSTSRFMRSVFMARAAKIDLGRFGVRVVSITQNFADDANGKMLEGIFETVDEYESRVIGARSATAMREIARQGYYPGSRPPYGFRFEKVPVGSAMRTKLVVDDAEAETARIVFSLYSGGIGAKSVARELNANGHRYRNGRKWTKDLVLAALESEAMRGTVYWGRRDPDGTIRDASEWVAIPVQPIVDEATFLATSELRESRAPAENPGRTASSPLLLAKLAFCQACGAPIVLGTSGKKGPSPYRYYVCRNASRAGAEVCKGVRYREDHLDGAVLDHLVDVAFAPSRCRVILAELLEASSALRDRTAAQRREIQRDLDAVNRAIERWQTAFENGDLDASEGAERLRTLRTQREDLRRTLAKIVPLRRPSIESLDDETVARFHASLVRRLREGGTLARQYLRFLVKRIEVSDGVATIKARTDAAAHVMVEETEVETPRSSTNEGGVRICAVPWLRMAWPSPNRSASPGESAPGLRA